MQIKYAIMVLSILSTGIFAVPVKRDTSGITPPPPVPAESPRQLETLLSGLVGNIISQVAPSIVTAIQNSITGAISSIFSRDDIATIMLGDSTFKSYLVDVPEVGSVVLVANRSSSEYKPTEKSDVDPSRFFKNPFEKPHYSHSPSHHSGHYDYHEPSYLEQITQHLQNQKDKIVAQIFSWHHDKNKPHYQKPHYEDSHYAKPHHDYYIDPHHEESHYVKPHQEYSHYAKPHYESSHYVKPHHEDSHYTKPHHEYSYYAKPQYEEKPSYEEQHTTTKPYIIYHSKPTYLDVHHPYQQEDKPDNKSEVNIDSNLIRKLIREDIGLKSSINDPDAKSLEAKETVAAK